MTRHQDNSIIEEGIIDKLVFSPDGKTLALHQPAGRVIFRDIAANKNSSSLTVGTGSVYPSGVAFSPDGRWFVMTGYMVGSMKEGTVALREFPTKQDTQWRMNRCEFRAAAFSPDSKLLALAGTCHDENHVDKPGIIVLCDVPK
jgi:WD40 repeat protein